ncbi:hypothetical protein HY798_00410 [Candidatus Falkowbacteria bacterium]|nr:hypothetical protein [Candidatus Falkowbacteria bacterium]
MAQQKNNRLNEEEIKIQEDASSVSEFVKRSLPSEKEVEKFDEFAVEEAKEEEIEEGLAEIYQDEKGEAVDVKKLEVRKRRGFLFWFFVAIFITASLGAAVYAAYYYVFIKGGFDSTAIKLTIEGKDKVLAGEEFFYIVGYKNLSNVDIKNIEIKLTYPEGFVAMESSPQAATSSAAAQTADWKFNYLAAHRSGEIKIKGKLIGAKDEGKIILATMTYAPVNFSSEFKKEAALETVISDVGVDFSFEANSSVLVGEENEIIVKYKKQPDNYLSGFRLTVLPLDNMEFGKREEKGALPGVWQINEIGEEEKEVKARFKFKDKLAEMQDLVFNFEYADPTNSEKYYKFLEQKFSLEVIKNNLNLNLIVNGSRNDQGIDFGQILNYSIVYANKGETEMKDIVIMAVLEGDILDWKTLDDKNNGKVSGRTISWSKNEAPALASLKNSDEGAIDFSIKVMPLAEAAEGIAELDVNKKYEIKSYAQFNIGSMVAEGEGGSATSTPAEETGDTKSNIIISKINSDLKLSEQVRYFDDDNIAVGFGPLPPKVGQTTSFKAYWTLTNNLHELENLQVETVLPDYVNWDDKNRATVGVIKYDAVSRKIIWRIGRLPITVYEAGAEFNINITPAESDRNKIMVLLTGTVVTATDTETQATISKTMPAKTTKLEDDKIAESDGVVE